jgi:hypothetical protein
VLKAAVQRPPRAAGIARATWQWKVVRQFVQERFGLTLSRSSCWAYLHRLGFVRKRPTKHLLKADEAKREAFVATYAALRTEAQASGSKIFFADEAHFYADVDLHGLWVLEGTPALVDSTSPRYGEKASYYSAVCLETGAVEAMPLEGNSSAATSVTFLKQLRAHHSEPLVVIWDNAPAHGGEPLRTYLATPGLRLQAALPHQVAEPRRGSCAAMCPLSCTDGEGTGGVDPCRFHLGFTLALEPHPDGSPASVPRNAYTALQAAGAQVKWSNPAFTFTHAKYLVEDGRAAWIGTMNWSASAFKSNREFGASAHKSWVKCCEVRGVRPALPVLL